MVVIIFLAAKLLIILIHPIWKNKNMKLCFIKTSLSETKFYLWRKNMEMFLWQYCLCFQTFFFIYYENEKKSYFFLSSFIQIDLSIMKTVTDRLSNMEPFSHVLLVSFFSHVMVCVTLQAQSNILSIPWIRN